MAVALTAMGVPCPASLVFAMRKSIFKSALRISLALAVIFTGTWIYIAQPTTERNQKSVQRVDATRLRAHVEALSVRMSPRNFSETANLERCAGYILKNFAQAGAATEIQEFTVHGKKYFNVIGRFGKAGDRKLIIGAHYDAAPGTPGADDNASGVAGLIELAFLIGKNTPAKETELVAYSLEEPPFFGTDMMGSAFHAAHIGPAQIEGVIVLEMIGCFSDRWGSQSYPMPLLNIFYPNRGNFIAVVGKAGQREFTRKVKAGMIGATDMPVYSINAPEFIPGIDFSDHRNYWRHGYNAVMITDTAFYRNREYHRAGDTSDRLDYGRMSEVVVGVFEAIKTL